MIIDFAKPAGWDALTIEDLFYAYRKAKADCFFERSTFESREFAKFELNLVSNLHILLARLQAGEIDTLLKDNLGEPRPGAKKLSVELNDPPSHNGHAFFSDADLEFERLIKNRKVRPEFRVIGHFPVIMHILSALWINTTGHLYDAVLQRTARGARLRRFRSQRRGQRGAYHREAIGSFEPYWEPYRRWRADGLDAIRRELKHDARVLAVTLDITSYYHSIDASFLLDPKFLEYSAIKLSEWQRGFTQSIVTALHLWAEKARADQLLSAGSPDGVPIGLSLSRIVANVLLLELDRSIQRNLAPIYYGRYVDDIFLVISDPRDIPDVGTLFAFIQQRCGTLFRRVGDDTEIALSYHSKPLKLQDAKQKLFVLHGQAGIDLLAHIESQIQAVSSERKLMASADDLESTASAKVLTAAASPTEEADTLRRADALSVRRFGWAIQLGKVETLVNDLPPEAWEEQRKAFYLFARNHVLRADTILDQIDYIPRLLSIAVRSRDWKSCMELADAVNESIAKLREHAAAHQEATSIKVNGNEEQNSPGLWTLFDRGVQECMQEAVLRSWPSEVLGDRLDDVHEKVLHKVGLKAEDIAEVAGIQDADLAVVPYKRGMWSRAAEIKPSEDVVIGVYRYAEDLESFLVHAFPDDAGSQQARIRSGSRLPFLFPTRPFSAAEIARWAPQQCVYSNTADQWAKFVRAARGVWVKDIGAISSDHNVKEPVVLLAEPSMPRSVTLGITSLWTPESSWHAAAENSPDLSKRRYRQIKEVVNQAIKARPKITHLLLPELSLPDKWAPTVSRKLQHVGINLIAGLEYQHPKPDSVTSEALLMLEDNRLGYPTWLEIRQPKYLPAPREQDDLRFHGKSWSAPDSSAKKPIYIQGKFSFGVLVCSELQNLRYRKRFQGKVDCVIVLSWNKDLDTFSSLIESASLDVHAFIALVNNRLYGDSRVRGPAMERFKRDLCLLRGGENDQVAVVTLDIGGLRKIQSRVERRSKDGDKYKPKPEGLKLKKFRRVIPE